MLQIQYIRENRDEVLARLKKKNFKEPELIDKAVYLDDNRKQVRYREAYQYRL